MKVGSHLAASGKYLTHIVVYITIGRCDIELLIRLASSQEATPVLVVSGKADNAGRKFDGSTRLFRCVPGIPIGSIPAALPRVAGTRGSM
jgi:hypothetical protein